MPSDEEVNKRFEELERRVEELEEALNGLRENVVIRLAGLLNEVPKRLSTEIPKRLGKS
jgi:hypothetical protein